MNFENLNIALKNYCEKSAFFLSQAIFLAATVKRPLLGLVTLCARM
jgi:hypothetical protein